MGYRGMLGEVEKKKKALYWCVSQLFLKHPHREVPLTMTIGQHQQQARSPALLLEYSRSSAGSVSACWPEASWGTQSHDAQTSPTESNH